MTTQVEATVSPLFEEQIDNDGKKIKVLVRQMRNKLEARSIFLYRPIEAHIESRWGGNAYCDDDCMLQNDHAKRCKMCMAVTQLRHLVNNICPDCDGRSEAQGIDPYKKVWTNRTP